MPETIFTKLAQSHGKRLMCIQSNIGNENSVQIRPLFLYHARRTSGIAFYFALKGAMETMFSVAGMKKEMMPGTIRVEDDVYYPPEFFGQRFALVASHANFGFHEKFAQSFILATIVREPYTRLGSTYLSGCMRNQTEPNISEFENFIARPESQNSTIRQLCGLTPDKEVRGEHLDAAIENLASNFDSYVTTRHTNDLISYYLSSFGLSNAVMNRPNRTRDRYQIDITPFRDVILERNDLDMKLFEFVDENPKIPRLEVEPVRYSPTTVIGYEDEALVDSRMKYMYTSTDKFSRTVDEHPEVLENLKIFWDLMKQSS